ncbi:putative exporter of the RND superfamily [Gottschalkia purinilytica]|uniref:Putative exporter of the RND superfamily n=1 Tax=Gottschalkia purinilytica TaxID=1503 RepID=A0A0L0W957_GOTPU|nr:MMPL family transporter [Gottschalkia purinilytica]KNF07966.1 putative exporter of the RND superfamily [Gottschalkia purinilytica]
MKGLSSFIAHHRKTVLVIALLLIIPSIFGMIKTDINYDLLTYLPDNLDSVKGQDIVDEVFGKAATGMLVVEGMDSRDVEKVKEKVEKVEGVKQVTWITDITDLSIPKEILPKDIKDIFYRENSTLLMIDFNGSGSSEETEKAIDGIRSVVNKQCFLSGVSTILKDMKYLVIKETPLYVIIATILSALVLGLTVESTVVPFIFLSSIGLAILYNFGTNIFLGEISYITKSLAAALQLGVTMDFSIFLLHRYEEELRYTSDKEEAMSHAITKTMGSITGSSLTTIAGFLALVTMKLGLGKDLGIVMAKGVLLGVICTVTILPALILTFDKYIHKYTHKTVLPEFERIPNFITKHSKLLVVIALVLFVPFFYGQSKLQVYYNVDQSLPKDLDSIVALNKLKTEYNMTTTHMIVVDGKVQSHEMNNMISKIEKVDGINQVLTYDKFVGPMVPREMIPDSIKETFEKDGYKMLLVNSEYKAATKEQNQQIDKLNKIIKSYDKNAKITGEGALTKDLVEIADVDFKNVNVTSTIAVFVIIMIVFRSISIPVILVSAIELAIFINMGISYFMGATVPFIASIVIGTIQLGATVDYAILLTTRFKEEMASGLDKYEAMKISIKESSKSIITSAFALFASTVGISLVAQIKMVGSITMMISRGAIISMFVIIFILPSILLLTEGIVAKTTIGWRKKSEAK